MIKYLQYLEEYSDLLYEFESNSILKYSIWQYYFADNTEHLIRIRDNEMSTMKEVIYFMKERSVGMQDKEEREQWNIYLESIESLDKSIDYIINNNFIESLEKELVTY